MKPKSPSYARNLTKKVPELKPTPSVRPSSSKSRRSPVVSDQTISTNSVTAAATDPSIRDLVLKQQQLHEQRISMDSNFPRSKDSYLREVPVNGIGINHGEHLAYQPYLRQVEPAENFSDFRQISYDRTSNIIVQHGQSEKTNSAQREFLLDSNVAEHHHHIGGHHHYVSSPAKSAVDTIVGSSVSYNHDDDCANSDTTDDAGEFNTIIKLFDINY